WLAAPPPGWGVRAGGGRGGGGAGFGLAAEELLLAQPQLSAEVFVLLLEQGFALAGAVVPCLPVAWLSAGLEFLRETWTNRTGAPWDGGRGKGRGSVRGRQRNPCCSRATRSR